MSNPIDEMADRINERGTPGYDPDGKPTEGITPANVIAAFEVDPTTETSRDFEDNFTRPENAVEQLVSGLDPDLAESFGLPVDRRGLEDEAARALEQKVLDAVAAKPQIADEPHAPTVREVFEDQDFLPRGDSADRLLGALAVDQAETLAVNGLYDEALNLVQGDQRLLEALGERLDSDDLEWLVEAAEERRHAQIHEAQKNATRELGAAVEADPRLASDYGTQLLHRVLEGSGYRGEQGGMTRAAEVTSKILTEEQRTDRTNMFLQEFARLTNQDARPAGETFDGLGRPGLSGQVPDYQGAVYGDGKVDPLDQATDILAGIEARRAAWDAGMQAVFDREARRRIDG